MLFEMIIDENLGGWGGEAGDGGLCRPQPLQEFNAKKLIMTWNTIPLTCHKEMSRFLI